MAQSKGCPSSSTPSLPGQLKADSQPPAVERCRALPTIDRHVRSRIEAALPGKRYPKTQDKSQIFIPGHISGLTVTPK
jgi:hypothetical protein